MNNHHPLWSLLQQSVIISGLLALILVSSVCYLAVTGGPVPDVLHNALGLILGFFFGARMQSSIGRARG